jgi:hypothetical protein
MENENYGFISSIQLKFMIRIIWKNKRYSREEGAFTILEDTFFHDTILKSNKRNHRASTQKYMSP